ncbi:MAG: precorrin-8X methylmutase [bacterium]
MKKMLPKEIEEKSFSIIEKRIPLGMFSQAEREIVKKVVHTTADFTLINKVFFSPDVIAKAVKILGEGRDIFTDVAMVGAGISPQYLKGYRGKVICEIRNPEVAKIAEKEGVTRSEAAVRYAVANNSNIGIFAIGNAPTALFEVIKLTKEGQIKEDVLVIGACVGMVGAAEAKSKLIKSGLPVIAIRGKRGGSPIAATVINGLFKIMKEGKYEK